MNGFNQNVSSQHKDCNSCTNGGFWWSLINGNCVGYQNNLSDINTETITNGTASCPNTAYPPIINTEVPVSQLDTIVGNDLNEGQLQTLADISVLQEMEKDYYSQLENGIAHNTLSSADEVLIMQKITELSAIRINLYKQLNQMYDFYKHNTTSTQHTIKEQLIAINIVEEELKNSAMRMQILNEENNAKMRMVEINRYYGDKYKDHSVFMKYFIFFTVITLITYALYKKLYINKTTYLVLMSIIIWYVCIIMGAQFYRMIFRSNMDYQEYTFPLGDITTTPSNSSSTTIGATINDPWINNKLSAINSCASGLLNTSSTPTTTSSSSTTATNTT